MTLPGECVNDTKTTCHECGTELVIDVQKSAAGYYIGFWCENCGPYLRRRFAWFGLFRQQNEPLTAISEKPESRKLILVRAPQLAFQGNRAIVADHTVLDSREKP